MKIALLKERKSPPDRRVVLSPQACKSLLEKYPQLEIVAESSDIRTFSDDEYREAGIPVSSDIASSDIMLGVKEVPVDRLIPEKSYIFFSHTIKKQPYNRKLLQAVLQKNIKLYDHELFVDGRGMRLIGFGFYAGIVGTYNGMRTYGLKYKLFELPKAETLADKKALIKQLKAIDLPAIKIVLTGTGRVGRGAKEILDAIKIKEVDIPAFLNQKFEEAVYVNIDALDYNKRKDGEVRSLHDFFENGDEYENDFMRFAREADMLIAGHFWDEESPRLITREQAASPDFNIGVIADISCDINGPIAATIRASSIAEPNYGYDPKTGKETDFRDPEAIAVMAVDNLPCELPRDASIGFGEMFGKAIIPAFFNDDKDEILHRALMTRHGKLTKHYAYLQDYVDGKE